MFEADFYLEEDLTGIWDTEPMTPSTRGVAYVFNFMGSNDGHGASGNNSYEVLD